MEPPSAQRTAELVHLALEGERSAFDELVRSHLRVAYAVALAFVRRPVDAEDVAQIAMVSAFEKLHTCREPQRFRAWLLQIVRNRARNWLEERNRRDANQAVSERGDRLHFTLQPETSDRKWLLKALGGLSEVRREVVILHDLEGWTHGEIAEALGLSEEMSRQHLFLARGELRAELEADQRIGGEAWKRLAWT